MVRVQLGRLPTEPEEMGRLECFLCFDTALWMKVQAPRPSHRWMKLYHRSSGGVELDYTRSMHQS